MSRLTACPCAMALRQHVPWTPSLGADNLARSFGIASVMITSFRPAVAALAAFVGLTVPDALHAQSYPARSVTLVVPSAAGGGTDTIARLIGDQLAKQLSQGFVVENRTGAGMLVGTTAVAKAMPDGYALLVGLNATWRSIPVCSPSCPMTRSRTLRRWRCSPPIRSWWS